MHPCNNLLCPEVHTFLQEIISTVLLRSYLITKYREGMPIFLFEEMLYCDKCCSGALLFTPSLLTNSSQCQIQWFLSQFRFSPQSHSAFLWLLLTLQFYAKFNHFDAKCTIVVSKEAGKKYENKMWTINHWIPAIILTR